MIGQRERVSYDRTVANFSYSVEMYEPRPCLACSVPFTPTSGRQKWCSFDCRFPEKTCPVCDQKFRTRNYRVQVCCSKKCSVSTRDMSAVRAQRRHNVGGCPKEATCLRCGETYAPTSSRQKWCQTCIPPMPVRNVGTDGPRMATTTCQAPTCGRTFEYPAKRKNRKYCSRACRSRTAMTPERMEQLRAANTDPLWRQRWKQRQCDVCGETYQPSGGTQRICSACAPDKAMRGRLYRYGITKAQLDLLWGRYDGMCWICRDRPAQTVDHCHTTLKVRGALCRGCNMALHFVERPDWWGAATAYLNGQEEECA